jgi:hypothetical protein
MLTDSDLHYLRSILGHLREVRTLFGGLSLGAEVLVDNIDWLDCFIDKHQKELTNGSDQTTKAGAA